MKAEAFSILVCLFAYVPEGARSRPYCLPVSFRPEVCENTNAIWTAAAER